MLHLKSATRFAHAVEPALRKGTRIVQADSRSDSDSESRNKNEEIVPVNRLNTTVCTDPPPLYAPALLNKGHSLRRLAPTLGIGVVT